MTLFRLICLAGILAALALGQGCATQGMADSPMNVVVFAAPGRALPPQGAQRVMRAAVSSAQDILSRKGMVVLDDQAPAGAYRGRRANKAVFYARAERLDADWMLLLTLEWRYKRQDRDHAFNRVVVSLSSQLLEVSTRRVLASTYGKLRRDLDTGSPSLRAVTQAAAEAAGELAENQTRELMAGR